MVTSNTPCEAFTGASSVLLAVLNDMAKELKAAMAAMAFQSLDELPRQTLRIQLTCHAVHYIVLCIPTCQHCSVLPIFLPICRAVCRRLHLLKNLYLWMLRHKFYQPTFFLWKNTPGTGSLPTDDCVTPGRGDGQTCANRAIVDLIIGPLD